MLLKNLSSSGTRFVSRTNTQMLSGPDSTIGLSQKQSSPVENLAKEATEHVGTAMLSITDNRPDPQNVSLTGTGTVVERNPANLGFGVVQVGQSKRRR
jgi:hypothetical protein